MYCNWQFIAPRLRLATEKSNSLTFFSYLENKFNDQSGWLCVVTALICFVFYTIYISAALVGLGLLVESLFHIPYGIAVLASIVIALPYVLIGGYRTLAWLDLFQGIFLMVIIVGVSLILLGKVGGFAAISAAAASKSLSLSIMPDFSFKSIVGVLLVALGWGLGYFGQPAIITKFMGIKNAKEIPKSKYIGMSWMVISMAAATLVGLVGLPFFNGTLENREMLFIHLVQQSFHPFLIGLILCAIFAASINVMCSQILVLSSSLGEDIYKRLFKTAKADHQLLVSRASVVVVALIAFVIAFFKVSTLYALVLYAWSGLGSAFGPLLIYSLYTKRADKRVAWVGILSGSLVSAVWPSFHTGIDPIIMGFSISSLSIWITSFVFAKFPKGAKDLV
jgi:sodium/proline symporter